MLRKWMKLGAVPALAGALWFAGCSDQVPTAGTLLTSEAPSLSASWSSAQKEELKRVYDAFKTEPFEPATEYSIKKWNLVEGKIDLKAQSAIKIVEPKGAELDIQGHKLVVPQGAVSTPTVFRMRLFPATGPDGQAVVGVDLRAVSVGSDLKWVDVGEQGFAVPVKLRLTYAIANNLAGVSPGQLQIIWVKSRTSAEATTRTVVQLTEKYIESQLDHFSRYALAFP